MSSSAITADSKIAEAKNSLFEVIRYVRIGVPLYN